MIMTVEKMVNRICFSLQKLQINEYASQHPKATQIEVEHFMNEAIGEKTKQYTRVITITLFMAGKLLYIFDFS
jgi:hypothetical protein